MRIWFMRRSLIKFIAIILLLANSADAAIRCNSASDAFTATTNLPTNTSFTMMGWFNIITDRNAATSFLNYGEHASLNEKTLETNADGTTLLLWDDSDGVSGTNLTAGKWYHLAFTYNDTNGLVYVNGVLDITNPTTTEPTTTMRIGNSPASEFLNGRFSCVKIWSVVLTAGEIANEMNHCRPLRTDSLNRWMPTTNNVLASDALDKSGNGRDFTVTSTPVVEADYPPVGW